MNVHAIIQARMGSSRLPGKTLKKLKGKTLLERVIDRAKKIKGASLIIVATSRNLKDKRIYRLCLKLGIPCYRGSEVDVLDRYVKTAKKYKSDVVVRLTADNPFLEPTAADRLIKSHIKHQNDYTLSYGYPLGTSCEIFDSKSLVKVNTVTTDKSSHEHLGVYFLKHPEIFKIETVKAPKDKLHPEIRLVIDVIEDYKTAQNIFEELGNDFEIADLIKLYFQKSNIFLNRNIEQYKPSKEFEKIFSGKDPFKKSRAT